MLMSFKRVIHRALRAMGYTLVRNPVLRHLEEHGAKDGRRVGLSLTATFDFGDKIRSEQPMADGRFVEIDAMLSKVTPWCGYVPDGYVTDFLGILRDENFLWTKAAPFTPGGGYVTPEVPTLATFGETYFEIADWFYSAIDASDRYVAVSLGAAYGSQLVGAWKTLQAVNPMPAHLVAVEPVPVNCEWIRKHMLDNGIDPDEHSIIQTALGADNEPVLFPVGAPGTGVTSAIGVNSALSRQVYVDLFQRSRQCERILRNIFLFNSTRVSQELGQGYIGELKFVSALTLRDVLSPFDRIDLLEVDIQRSELDVIEPCFDTVNRKVRRVHIGTHGRDIHAALRALFFNAGWQIVFDYAPDSRHKTERGVLELGDGIMSARNPAV
jgi:FkbM family methyltransferase